MPGQQPSMQPKNKSSKLGSLAAGLLLLFLLTGCGSPAASFVETEVNPKIDVFGIKLNMTEAKLHELISPKVEKAMCIYGYEYDYRDRMINIGFSAKTSLVRRVMTKNPETSIYGLKPGIALEEAYAAIEPLGFVRDDSSKYRFFKENVILSITSMTGSKADGITIEIKPE